MWGKNALSHTVSDIFDGCWIFKIVGFDVFVHFFES